MINRRAISDKNCIGCINIITGTEKVPNLSMTASARFLDKENRVNKRALLRANVHFKADAIPDGIGSTKF